MRLKCQSKTQSGEVGNVEVGTEHLSVSKETSEGSSSHIALPSNAINSSSAIMSDIENDPNSKPPDDMDEKDDLTTPLTTLETCCVELL